MFQSAEVCTRPSQTSKINLLARIVNAFKLTLLTIFAKSTIMDVERALITPLICSNPDNILNVSQSMSRQSSFYAIRYVNFIKTSQVRWC